MNFSQIRLENQIQINNFLDNFEIIQSKSSLLLDYFSISIENGLIYSLPELINGYKPSFSSISLFLFNLNNINWDDETECLNSIINEISSLSSPIPNDENNLSLMKQIQNELINIVLPKLKDENYYPSDLSNESIVKFHTNSSLYNLFN